MVFFGGPHGVTSPMTVLSSNYFIACSLVDGGTTWPQSCSLGTAVILSPAYTAIASCQNMSSTQLCTYTAFLLRISFLHPFSSIPFCHPNIWLVCRSHECLQSVPCAEQQPVAPLCAAARTAHDSRGSDMLWQVDSADTGAPQRPIPCLFTDTVSTTVRTGPPPNHAAQWHLNDKNGFRSRPTWRYCPSIYLETTHSYTVYQL
jgi:hypothetical protein